MYDRIYVHECVSGCMNLSVYLNYDITDGEGSKLIKCLRKEENKIKGWQNSYAVKQHEEN